MAIKVKIICKCGKEFEDYASNERSGFCSLKCYWDARKGNEKYAGYWSGKKRLEMQDSGNPKWRGDKVSYAALHQWVVRKLGRPKKCEHCGVEDRKWYHWANKSGEYKRDLSDWIRLCVPCHRIFDGWTGRGNV